MSSWYNFQIVLMISIIILAVLAVGLITWDRWREMHRKGSREVAISRSRGRSLFQTEHGWLTIVKYTPYTDTEYHFTLMDHNRVKYNKTIGAHELRCINILQAAVGPGPAMFVHVPGDRARMLTAAQYQQGQQVGVMHEYKMEAERVDTRARISEARSREHANELLDKHAQLDRSKQAPNQGGKR